MYPSERCYDLIKRWEGIMDGDPSTVNLDAYLCPANVVTIGWGHVVRNKGIMLRGQDGLRQARVIYPDGITMTDAKQLLEDDVAVFAAGVNRLVKVPMTQGQFDALVSFSFNVGLDEDDDAIAEGLGDSSLLRYFNAGNPRSAADEFGKWINAGGVPLVGLARRRAAERELFFGS